MPRALVIETDGSQKVIDLPTETAAQVAAIHEALDGYLEFVLMPNGLSMFCDEHGKIKERPVNARATRLSGLFPRDVIAGPVVIMGKTDALSGDTLGLTDEDLDALFAG